MNERLPPLPRGWCWVGLADVARLVTGGTPPGKEDGCYGGDTPFYKPTDLNAGRFVVEARQYLTPHGATFLDVVPAGSVLITCIGATIGKTGLTTVPCATNQQINAAVPIGVEPEFLYWFAVTPSAQSWIVGNASATTLPILNKGRLATMPVAIAPAKEQRRIVAKLDGLAARSRRAREALGAIPPLLEKLRQSILAAAFRGDLTKDWREKHPDGEPASELLKRIRVERRKKWEEAELAKMKAKGKVPGDDRWKAKYKEPEPVDASGLPELPPGWCWASVEELCPGDAPAVYGIILPGEEVPGGVPYLRPIDIRPDGSIDFESVQHTSREIAAQYERASLREGDVVLSIVGTIGKVVIVPPELQGGNITQSSARIRPPLGMPSEYLRFALLSPPLTRQYDKVRFGNAVQRLNVEHVRRLAIPLTSAEEMVALTSAVRDALATIPSERVEQLAVELAQLDRSILAKAFRGELVPQDPNDEPASVMLERVRAADGGESGRANGRAARGRG